MGGLIIVVLWPFLLPIAFLYFLGVALPVLVPIALVWNLLVLAGLLLFRWLWRKTGTMNRAYFDAQTGWKRALLLLLLWGLRLCIAWEVLLILACAAYLLWFPELLQMLVQGVLG